MRKLDPDEKFDIACECARMLKKTISTFRNAERKMENADYNHRDAKFFRDVCGALKIINSAMQEKCKQLNEETAEAYWEDIWVSTRGL